MLDFDQADTGIDVNTYRKRVLAVYSGVGFAIAGLVFLCTMDSMDDGVSTWTALAFIGIIGVFSWVGCATANAIYSVDDGWYPWVHRWALVKSLPLAVSRSAGLHRTRLWRLGALAGDIAGEVYRAVNDGPKMTAKDWRVVGDRQCVLVA
jgi:hypothetical protein